MKQHRFYGEGSGWYIDLPKYLEQGGSKGDLAMVAGKDKDVTIQMDILPFVGADELVLTERCSPGMGGGYYFMKSFEEKDVCQRMWLCGVTEFVFGCLPEKIYVKRS